MLRRPICIVCLMLMTLLYLLDLAGVSLSHEKLLPDPILEWTRTEKTVEVLGEVREHTVKENTDSVFLTNTSLIYQSKEIPIQNLIVSIAKNSEVPTGAFVVVSGKLEEIEPPRNPGEFDQKNYYACKKVYYRMRKGTIVRCSQKKAFLPMLTEKVKNSLREKLCEAAGDYAPYYEAMLLGDKTEIEEETRTRFGQAGFLHILTISGLHIGILGTGLFTILVRSGIGFFFSGFLSFVLMLFYAVLTGSGASTLRAVVMFVLSVGAKLLGRSYDGKIAMAVSALLLLLDNPAWIYSSSFWLSFTAVLTILAVVPYVLNYGEIGHSFVRSAVTAIAIPVFMAPVQLWFSGELSLMGVLMNLLLVPTVGIVLLLGLLIMVSGYLYLPLARILAFPGNALLKGYVLAGELASGLPYGVWIGGKPTKVQIILFLFLVSGFLYAFRNSAVGKRRAVLLILPFFLLILQHFSLGKLRITFLDVGQGDCAVVSVPSGGDMLIDCGSSSDTAKGKYTLLPFLKEEGISELAYIVVSHTDEDHISGVRELLTMIQKRLTVVRVRNLVLPALQHPGEAYLELLELAEQCGISVHQVSEGTIWKLGQAKMHVLSPEADASGENVNEDALVVELSWKNLQVLFTGDIGSETEQRLYEKLEDIDLLKVAHHGSRYSTSEGFLNRVRPEIAVISCAEKNTYGHPSPETISRLKDSGCQVEYTMLHGAIAVQSDGKRLSVRHFCDKVSTVHHERNCLEQGESVIRSQDH